MILILTNSTDHSSFEVAKWLNYKKEPFIRISSLNDIIEKELEINIDNEMSNLVVEEQKIILNDIKSIWYRRHTNLHYINYSLESSLLNSVNVTIQQELASLFNALKFKIKRKKWLNHPDTGDISKMHQLYIAKKCGLKIPETLITSSKEKIGNFLNIHKKIIIKPIKNAQHHTFENKNFMPFTSLVTKEEFEKLPSIFFPTLFQSNIEKEFEIRAFFLDGKFYSMAIFSQEDIQTSVDFRIYNYNKPNRRVPFKLPKSLEKKMKRFMKILKLNSGSFDIIKDKKGEYFFLEVNPVGQFGMVSQPCNYYLEEKIAQTLISYDK